ncbi:MAG: winged helix-turn-helix domain-containing protein, partial [Acidobacteriota bacterium]
MVDPADAALRFDDFELHPESGELFHQQRPIHLQQQPARVLEILARRPGEVVTRGELRQAIWGEGHHVDADQGLNYCVRQIRLALDDRADAPRFVETVPRRGYRFVAPILAASTPSEPAESKSAPFASPELASPVRQRATWWLLGIAAGWVMVSGLRFAVPRPDSDHSAPLGPAAIPQAGLESSIDSLPADAREAYLRGVYLAARPLTQGRLRAVAPLEEAIALAPDFAPAHAAWAGLILVLHQPPLETLPQVEAAAERALGLDPELVAGHVVRGKVRMARHHDWA